MAHGPVRWSDDVDDVITGDITAAVAYVSPIHLAPPKNGTGPRRLGRQVRFGGSTVERMSRYQHLTGQKRADLTIIPHHVRKHT